ncbi:unnamed protein product [Rotaria socialis]|uniref:Uncharacterized protein n=1 Tax=Rotaria socialis TaxID=392032 RepID=A0A820VSR5_9BILA|nr:unnamed protein product [Rotaria socialis]
MQGPIQFAPPGHFKQLPCNARDSITGGNCYDWYYRGDARSWQSIQRVHNPGQISTDIYRRDRDWEQLNKRRGANYDSLGLLAVAAAGLGLLHAYGHRRENFNPNRRHNSNPPRRQNHISTAIPSRNRNNNHTFISTSHYLTQNHTSTTIPARNRNNNHISTTIPPRNRAINLGAFNNNLAAMNALSNANFNNALSNFNNSFSSLSASAAA